MNPHKIYFISDLHLGHNLMTQPRTDGTTFRKQGHEERILKAWSHIVKPTDHVYMLGDIAMTKVSYWFSRIKELPGTKHLVCGNHDQNRAKWYLKYVDTVSLFGELNYLKLELGANEVTDPPITYWGNILLSHVPAFESVGTAYDSRFQGLMRKGETWFHRASCLLNIHGHTHGKGAEKHNTIDIGIDAVGEYPISLEQILHVKFPGIGLPKVQV